MMPVGRFAVSATAMGLVVLGTLAAMIAAGDLSLAEAVLIGIPIILGQSIILRGLLTGSASIRRNLLALLDAPEDANPSLSTASPAVLELWLQIMRLVRLYRTRLAQTRVERDAVNAVLSALPDPVLQIDERRTIRRANMAALEFFGDRLDGRDLSVAIRNPAVLAAVDAVIRGDGGRVIEFDLTAPVERALRARIEHIGDLGASVLLSLTDLTTVKRAEQLRADFVANASHELRTPLSTIIGFIETLEGPAAEDRAARDRFLPIMREQAARMARLVDDLLSLSRIELHEHLPPRDRVDLSHIISDVATSLQLKATQRRMRIEFAPPAQELIVPGDPDELTQVMQNLIENALKYGRPDTAIRIGIAPSGRVRQGVAVWVRDEGDGIERRHLPRLTERFYRVDSARSRAMGGTGLGLAIVKHIVSRHRGTLEIESEVGRGSLFTVHLPSISKPELAAGTAEPAPLPARQAVSGMSLN